MQQFASISVRSRSIAWLLRLDEWDRFETIIKYNCAMLGGYYNVVIPLTSRDTVAEEYERFLSNYDPDFIVLAPEMDSLQLEHSSGRLFPFTTIPWEHVKEIVTLDPWSGGSGISATMGANMHFQKESSLTAFVAVADKALPDASRLALVACGDVEPREPMWNVMDDDVDLSATGYREMFFRKFLSPGYSHNVLRTHVRDESEIVSAPDRFQLATLISEEHRFPLTDALKMLGACCKLQYHPDIYQSFIGLTVGYSKEGAAMRTYNQQGENTPSMVMLVSDSFRLNEAILFWNLRASGFIVTWLPFQAFESNSGAIVKWLDSDYGGTYYAMMKGKGLDIVFACPNDDHLHLQRIFEHMRYQRNKNYPKWRIVPYTSLVLYDYIRPSIMDERVVIIRNNSQCTFVPKLPQKYMRGEYTVNLEWSGLMAPQNSLLVHNRISSDKVIMGRALDRDKTIPRFRITKERYLAVQVSSEHPVEFNRPSPEQIIETLFSCAGFSRIERSSAAKYHSSFIHRAGSLDEAVYYLGYFRK